MSDLFNTYLVTPFFNALILIYNFLPLQDIGLATIILTFIIRIVFFPIFYKGIRQQIIISRIQPELLKIQKEYKDDKEKQVKAQFALYKKHKVNPFSGCLLTLLQLPIIFAVYQVFLNGFSNERMADLYKFVSQPETINTFFLGFINLSKPNIGLAFISALLQFIASKMLIPFSQNTGVDQLQPAQKMANIMQKQMVFIGPIMTLIILISLPSIIALYWAATTIFSISQQWFIQKTIKVDQETEIKENGGN